MQNVVCKDYTEGVDCIYYSGEWSVYIKVGIVDFTYHSIMKGMYRLWCRVDWIISLLNVSSVYDMIEKVDCTYNGRISAVFRIGWRL